MSEINENEAKVIGKTKSGGTIYKNSSTAADIQEAKALYLRLRKQIQAYSSKYSDENPNSVEFRYNIGKLLFDISHAEGVTNSIRTEFLKEIEEMTDVEVLIGRPLGSAGSDKRHPYLLTCFWLCSTFEKDVAFLLNWSDWSEIYARPKIRNDSRIAKWVAKNKKDLTRETIREVFKALTYLVEEYDLSFMDDEDIFMEMDKALLYERSWSMCFEKYFQSDKSKMSAARREQSAKYKEKYIRTCIERAMFAENEEIPAICEEIFKEIYVNV